MKQILLSPHTAWFNGVVLIRLIIGYLFIHYGWDIFKPEQMEGYIHWTKDEGFRPPAFWAYLGKATELAGGILLMAGLFTRLITIPLMINMAIITFKFHEGKPLDGDELPFFLMLFAFLFFLVGPGQWSLDYLFFSKNRKAP